MKCDDADRVATAIDHLLQKQQWQPTDQVPDEDESRWGASGSRRAILVSAPVYGWVSVLDSDLAGEFQLANDLAERLNAYSLLVLVNDSDSWGYSLARGDGPLDSFGLEEEYLQVGSPPIQPSEAELREATEKLEKMRAVINDGSLMSRIQQIQNEAMAQAPPEIRAVHKRIQHHEATPNEFVRFYEWNTSNKEVASQTQQAIRELLDMPDFVFPAQTTAKKKRKRKPTKAQLAAARERIDHLRPLFVNEATDEEVQELFNRKALFAEETLAQFLPLFGIPSFYAYLDYSHHNEASPEELAAHAVRFVHHLKYETTL